MNALPLIDLALSRLNVTAPAGRVTGAALEDLAALQAVDEELGKQNEHSFDHQAAELMNGAYERWSYQGGLSSFGSSAAADESLVRPTCATATAESWPCSR